MVTLESLRATLEALPASDGRDTALVWVRETPTTRGGTMRAWMQAHHGERVDTLQASHSNGRLWAPLGRTVDASRATRVELNGSSRHYAGCRVIASSATVLAVTSSDALIIYRVSGE